MSAWQKQLFSAIFCMAFFWCMAGFAQNTTRYLITNNDTSQGNTATFFTIGTGGALTQTAVVPTGGYGWDGLGAVVTNKINISHDAKGDCAYLSDWIYEGLSGRPEITSIDIPTQTVVGKFKSLSTDQVHTNGMGLASTPQYIYAEFSDSRTIGAFKRLAGCRLQFLGDTHAIGLTGTPVQGMKAHQNILVVTYFDGSVQSFDISGGIAVANDDLQFPTAYTKLHERASAVDISADGHYAIFGDAGDTVEVSDISGGTLAPTTIYSGVGTGTIVGGLSLSPDGTLLYITDFYNGKVSAAFFDQATGAVSPGCTSDTLRGFGHLFAFVATVVTALPIGTGTALFTDDPDRRISTLGVTENSGTCSLTESPNSPVYDANTDTVESIGVFPPRRF